VISTVNKAAWYLLAGHRPGTVRRMRISAVIVSIGALVVAGYQSTGDDHNAAARPGRHTATENQPRAGDRLGREHPGNGGTRAHVGTVGRPPSDRAVDEADDPPHDGRRFSGLSIPGNRLVYESDAAVDADLDRVADLGARWLRVDAAWAEIETEPGNFNWSALDRVVDAAGARNLSVLLVVGTSAQWARPPDAEWNYGPSTDDQQASFARFAGALAERYRGQVTAYEVWNEPNLPGSWAPRPDPAAYVRLLRVTYAAIHDVDDAATVMSGGPGDDEGIDTMAWYEALYAGGLHSVCDAVAVHPYPNPPEANSGLMATAHDVRELMNAHGDGGKRLWGTETGAPTGGSFSVSEQTQAQLLRGLYAVWTAMPEVGPLFYYTLDDFGGTDRENYFGLTRADGSLKPAFSELQNWIRHANATDSK